MTGERGAAGAVTMAVVGVAAVLVLLLIGLTAGVLRAWPAASHAADATALAVLSGSPLAGGGGEPDLDAGRAVAAANGARLASADLAGWPRSVIVTIRRPLRLPWGDHEIAARAAAALQPSRLRWPDR